MIINKKKGKRKSSVVYNPNLTIAENAQNNHVSPSTIRWYLRKEGIDRKRDNEIRIHREISAEIKKHPDLTLKELSQKLNYSINTIRKYRNRGHNPVSKITGEKLSTFDTSSQKFIISSVSENQDELLNNILRLYIPDYKFDCDFTYSKGVFYKHVPEPSMKFDKYPQTDDTLPLDDAYTIPPSSFNSVIIDLPFVICNNKVSNNFPYNCQMVSRFNHFSSPDELYDANITILDLAHNKLKKGGIMVVKTMDVVFATKYHCISNFVINSAIQRGFELIDTFILISKSRMLIPKLYIQKHSRKYHSYFLVFKKN